MEEIDTEDHAHRGDRNIDLFCEPRHDRAPTGTRESHQSEGDRDLCEADFRQILRRAHIPNPNKQVQESGLNDEGSYEILLSFRRHIARHDAIRTNLRAISHSHCTQDPSSRSDDDAISNGGMSLASILRARA
jgi:hypothetical protein